MAHLRIGDGSLQLLLTPLERLGGFHGPIVVPLTAVQGAWIADQPFSELRGLRAPGTGVPGLIALGTWRYSGAKDFVTVYGGQRALVLDLSGTEFARLVIGMSDPETALSQLERSIPH